MKAAVSAMRRELKIFSRGDLIAQRYRVIDCLGFGEQTAIYRCSDLKSDYCDVTVKTLHLQFCQDEVTTRRFHQEVMASFQVESINTVRSLDYFKTPEVIGYSMEYAGKFTLKDLIDKGEPISIDRATNILIQLCDGLSAIHQAGIIHRDIKPGNIFILEDGTVKISDFGIARLTFAPKLTVAGEVRGTIGYSSPEYLEFGRVDHRSDIYALGLVAYEMISGSFPFIGESPIAALRLRLTSDPRPLSSLRTDCPIALGQAISKAMQRDPVRRFEDVSQFKAALLASCRPVAGEAISLPYAANEESEPRVTSTNPADRVSAKSEAVINTQKRSEKLLPNAKKRSRRIQYATLMLTTFFVTVLGAITIKLIVSGFPDKAQKRALAPVALVPDLLIPESVQAPIIVNQFESQPSISKAEPTKETAMLQQADAIESDPIEAAEPVAAELAVITEEPIVEQPVRRSYKVRPGDTTFRVAQKFGVSQESLLNLNRIIDPDILLVGQSLSIPRADEVIEATPELINSRREAAANKRIQVQPEIQSASIETAPANPIEFSPVTTLDEVLQINEQALGQGLREQEALPY